MQAPCLRLGPRAPLTGQHKTMPSLFDLFLPEAPVHDLRSRLPTFISFLREAEGGLREKLVGYKQDKALYCKTKDKVFLLHAQQMLNVAGELRLALDNCLDLFIVANAGALPESLHDHFDVRLQQLAHVVAYNLDKVEGYALLPETQVIEVLAEEYEELRAILEYFGKTLSLARQTMARLRNEELGAPAPEETGETE